LLTIACAIGFQGWRTLINNFADVYYDGKKLADVLLKNNIAVKYDGGTKTKDWSK